MGTTDPIVIALFTDFGWQGPYVGQLKAALQRVAAGITVIDLLHDAPMFNPQASAYLLNALCRQFETGTIFVGVVDPGVGHQARRPVIVQADGQWFVGPDNGLFNVVAQAAKECRVWEIHWQPPALSASFHGRDLFAPIAAMLAQGVAVETLAQPLMTLSAYAGSVDVAEIIYIDHYGNCMTGLRGASINQACHLVIAQHVFYYARTFAAVPAGQGLWYINSIGLVELAINQGNFQQQLACTIGQAVTVLNA